MKYVLMLLEPSEEEAVDLSRHLNLWPEPSTYHSVADALRAIRAHGIPLDVEMLRELEQCGTADGGEPCCPVCGGIDDDKRGDFVCSGHYRDCRLAALLEKL